MAVTIDDFVPFFQAVNGGHAPFAWQQRLLDRLVETGVWPEYISAPTGSGKSAVVEVHVFANALAASEQGPRVPRRLWTVVGRRGLVDSQADRTERVQEFLLGEDDLARRMRTALTTLCVPSDQVEQPLGLAHLRGGLGADNAWLDDPSRCAVICTTPDLGGSRLLMRGYGTSMYARPREAGLLAVDTALVVDEAHLNRQFGATARRVSELVNRGADLGIPRLQVVEATATPAAEEAAAVGVEEADFIDGRDRTLASRLMNPKPVTYVPLASWSGKRASNAYIRDLADQVLAMRASVNGGTIGCIVNRVDTAIRVADEVQRAEGIAELGGAECWVGRLRPMDLDALRDRCRGLFDGNGPAPAVLVATQTIEVGVDIDLAGMVTELAPGTALTQRAGRVNRRGLLDEAPLVVVGPDRDAVAEQLPYAADDLAAALEWLGVLEEGGLTAWAVRTHQPPGQQPERPLIKLPQAYDVQRWEDTSFTQLAEEDLALWLRESLEPDEATVGVVLRDHLPDDDTSALELLKQTRPTDDEVFPSSLWVTRTVLTRLADLRPTRVFLERGEELTAITLDPEAIPRLQPADLVILDALHAVTRRSVVVADDPDPRDRPTTGWGRDVVVIVPTSHQCSQTADVADFPDGDHRDLLTELVGLSPEDAQAVITERFGPAWQVTLPQQSDDGAELPWLVLRLDRAVAEDEDVRQEWSPEAEPVLLSQHAEGVANRAALMADAIGLRADLRDSLSVAGLHHDDGKAHRAFQVERLGNSDRAVLLAKSRRRNSQSQRRAVQASSLPRGWRHELRSVAVAWGELEQAANGELTKRLVGTSHGHGRSLPMSGAMSLVDSTDPSELIDRIQDLYLAGEWTALMDRTSQEWGPWGCAYLEAVLRAADCGVSKEGS
ncbi:type I-G CRISPR-associated helicase/endonuclease Cas3g [Parenemella sanctibonifatiensis]|uniref:Type I-U CRISPR-associated helicase/endonuclease Cas3 n=1 Tax=Parenemella sanctibonifatiensis TaxID=2016505 RepID=A0A255EJW3_9ACTN|nr:type I-U CRISPR-associated helicase/endonuclease Cas3 [Parenemella sanctibonifatiensis]OYN91530.1 type I-U CRISPR-associated helicase/endonuclease Cas3 [Parenemella sanctibonifatiensis]